VGFGPVMKYPASAPGRSSQIPTDFLIVIIGLMDFLGA
jgi:hypothetical protein